MNFTITQANVVAFALTIVGPLIVAQILMHWANSKSLKRMIDILELCPPHAHFNGKIYYIDKKTGRLTEYNERGPI